MAANDSGGFDRREFLGGAFLTTAGAATAGLAYWKSRQETEAEIDVTPQKDNPVKLGFIGVGRRGGALLRSALNVPGSSIVALCDVQEDARNAARGDINGLVNRTRRELQGDDKGAVSDREVHAKINSIPVKNVTLYSDYRDVLNDENVDAVVIATPQYLHGPMALDALEAGKHVYCEKALALTIGENRDILELAKARPDQVFQVGHQRHYSPLYRKVVEMVHTDHIGDVVGLRAQWNRNDLVRRPSPNPAMERTINWRLYNDLSGGLTTEFASHQIDVMNWILGTHPDSVCGYGGVDWYSDGRDTEDNIHLIFNYKVPVLKRDAYGRPMKTGDGRAIYETKNGKVVRRDVRFTYTSIMQNAHLGPSELILGRYGTLEVSLRGAEFFKEKKARLDPDRIAEGTDPRRRLQKRVLTTGSTVDPTTAGLPRKSGEPVRGETTEEDLWVEHVGGVRGAYDKHETMLAIDSFLDCIRKAKANDNSFKADLSADVLIGVWGSVPALMANIAMREQRIVYWKEFFPEESEAAYFLDDAGELRA